jgi:hypothetical protein
MSHHGTIVIECMAPEIKQWDLMVHGMVVRYVST